MSRSSAIATDTTTTSDFESNQPTRPLPTVSRFDLIAESRRLDAADRAGHDDDRTVTVSAEENERLLATVFATPDLTPLSRPAASAPSAAPAARHTDDELTLAAPSPLTAVQLSTIEQELAIEPPPAPAPVRISTRPPALRSLVLTKPAPSKPAPAPASASISGVRPCITPEVVLAARAARDEQATATRPSTPWLPTTTSEKVVVAGIWAMAVSLAVLLMVMVTSA